MFGVPYGALRYDVIHDCAEEPAQRIEYIAAWEVPLAVGRVLMMLVMMALYGYWRGNELALRIILFAICALRILTYQLTVHTKVVSSQV